jgi:uncharacterized protein (DUF4415 family)
LTREEMANVKDEDIDFSDIPELGDEFWNNAVIEVPEQLRSVTLRVRESVVDEFRRRTTTSNLG